MKWQPERFFKFAALGMLWAFSIVLAGCGTPSTTVGEPPPQNPTNQIDRLRAGDLIIISFSGNNAPPKHEERIKDDGTITPSTLFPPVPADGKTPVELQQELQRLYSAFYRNLTVTITTELRWFYVLGEVRNPGRFQYSGEVTVTQAIATASGFTDWGNKRNVVLTRSTGGQEVVNCLRVRRDPKLDKKVLPGDKIEVLRSRL